MKEWLKKLVEDEHRDAPTPWACLYGSNYYTRLNEEGIRETRRGDEIDHAELSCPDAKDAEIARLREEMEQLRQDRASVITSLREAVRGIVEVVWVFDPRESLTEGQYGADLVRVWGRITQERNEERDRLREELAQYDKWIPELCREIPCGAHPRLLSLGQPARFSGGCGSALIAPEAIVCADCGAWYCSRECISKHFGNEPSEAISSLECQLAQVRLERDAAVAALNAPWVEAAREVVQCAITKVNNPFDDSEAGRLNQVLDEAIDVLISVSPVEWRMDRQ